MNYPSLRFVFIASLLITVLMLTAGHCAVSKKHDNSLGVVQYDSNPLMYTAGNLADNDQAVTNVDGNLNLRVLPLDTYALWRTYGQVRWRNLSVCSDLRAQGSHLCARLRMPRAGRCAIPEA